MKSFIKSLVCAVVAAVAFVPAVFAAQAGTITLSPTSYTFPTEYVGLVTQTKDFVLTSTIRTSVTIESFSISNPVFQLTQGTAPMTLTGGTSAHFTIAFAPQAAQAYTGTFTINVSNGYGPFTATLSGTGETTGAVGSLSPTSINFGNAKAGTTTATQTVNVTNSGTQSMTLTSVSADPPFTVATKVQNVPIGAGQTYPVKINFSPTGQGAFNNVVTFAFKEIPTLGANMSGTGTADLNPTIQNFPTLPLATQSASYYAPLAASGGTGPYTFAVKPGSTLPTGLSLSTAGVISGTPTKVGTGSFTIQVTDSKKKSGQKLLSLTIDKATGASCNNISWDIVNTNTPITPIDVLGTGTYLGYEGGLYPDGSNIRPAGQDSYGVTLADQIQPLDADGTVDPINGKEVIVLMGESTVHVEAAQIVLDMMADPAKNSHVVVVNGGQGNGTASEFDDVNSPFWTTITNYILPNAGVTANQVVAIWFEPTDILYSGTFPTDVANVTTEIEDIMRDQLVLFPNVKLSYLSSRIYAAYSNGLTQKTNPEPYAYEEGWSVKWAIEDQLDGDPNLNYNPSLGPVKAPWMSWASYYWGNGLTPRPDGLVWTCQDFVPDGVHPSTPLGAENVANEVVNFFETDDSAAPWFLANPPRR